MDEALRRKQLLGTLLSGSSVGGGTVSRAGLQMLQDVQEESDRPLTNTLKELKIQKAQKDLDDPGYTAAMENVLAATGLDQIPRDQWSPEQHQAFKSTMSQYLLKPDTVIGGTGVEYGSIPSGYARVPTAEGGVVDRPIEGSKQYVDAVQGTESLYRGIQNVSDMVGLVEKHGTEAWGPTSTEMSSLYGDILATVAEAQNKGVLQQGEVEMIMKGLPNPGDWSQSYRGKDSIVAGYKNVMNQLNRKLAGQRKQFEDWGYEVPTPSFGSAPGAAEGSDTPTQGNLQQPTPDQIADELQKREARKGRRSRSNR